MSVAVDTNILVSASNSRDPASGPCRALLERLANGPDLVYLFWPAIMGYLRIVTHPRILPRPLTFVEASESISSLLGRPHVRTVAESSGFWDIFLATAMRSMRGNDIPDAHLATLMRQHGITVIYSRDRDFRKYDGIVVRDPVT